MYSRYQSRPENELHLPKNYSGWAFAERKGAPQPTPHRIDVALPSPPPESTVPHSAPLGPMPPSAPSLPPSHEPLPPPSTPSHEKFPCEKHTHAEDTHKEHQQGIAPIGLPAALGKKFPFSHGIGSDELILLGLIFLLSQNEHETDLPLWLTLLLFSG